MMRGRSIPRVIWHGQTMEVVVDEVIVDSVVVDLVDVVDGVGVVILSVESTTETNIY